MTKQLRLDRFLFLILLIVFSSVSNAQDLFSTGVLEFQNKNYKAAAEAFEKFIALQPNEAQAYQYLINAYVQLKEYDKAIKLLEDNKLRFGQNKDVMILLGKLYLNNQQFGKAETTLTEINRQYPEDAEVKMLLARIYYNKGIKLADKEKYNEAIGIVRKSISFDNNFPEAYAMLGNLLLQSDRIEEADKVFNEGLSKFPDNDVLLGNYALVMIKKKNYDKAIKDLEKVWGNNPDNIQVGLQLAKLYRVKYKIPEALEIYESLLKKYPQEKVIYNEMLEYYTVIDDQQNRRKVLERMEKAFPKDEKITLDKIKTYEKEGKDSLAIYHYKEYVKTHPKEFDVYFILADLYEKNRDYKNAKDILLRGNALGLKTEEYYLKLGNICEKENNLIAAKDTYREMIKRYPSNFLPYLRIGNIFFDEGGIDSARAYYYSVIKIDEKQPFALAKLAELYAGQNDVENALSFYKKSFLNNMIALNQEQQVMMSKLQSTNNLLELMDKVDFSREERMRIYKQNIEDANEFLISNLSNENYLYELDKLIDDYPTSSILYYYKGMFYEKNNDFKTAEKFYLRVLSVSPKDIEAHKRIAQLYIKMDQNGKAIQSYKRVLSLNNKDREAYKSLIKLYREDGRLSELCDDWMRVYFTQPENEVLREFLIEALHKANRKEDAAKIINESDQNG